METSTEYNRYAALEALVAKAHPYVHNSWPSVVSSADDTTEGQELCT